MNLVEQKLSCQAQLSLEPIQLESCVQKVKPTILLEHIKAKSGWQSICTGFSKRLLDGNNKINSDIRWIPCHAKTNMCLCLRVFPERFQIAQLSMSSATITIIHASRSPHLGVSLLKEVLKVFPFHLIVRKLRRPRWSGEGFET